MWNSTGEKRILQGITVCLVSAVLSTMWWPGSFQTMSRGHILVFFNRHCSTMNLVKEKQGGLVPTGLKRWPIKLIKHFADATGVSPSPAGPTHQYFFTIINYIFEPYVINVIKKCRWTVFKSVGELSSNLSVNCLQKSCRWIVLSVNCLVPAKILCIPNSKFCIPYGAHFES